MVVVFNDNAKLLQRLWANENEVSEVTCTSQIGRIRNSLGETESIEDEDRDKS